MLIIPAIDIRKGRCIRLAQGNVRDETVYSEQPVSVAKLWQLNGAKMIHLVDIDGAITGAPKNLATILKIVRAVKIPVQMGGGIRDMETLEKVFDGGVERAILGTSAVTASLDFLKDAYAKYKNRIIVGIDAKRGLVAINGWKEITNRKALNIAKEVQDIGIKEIIYTDIEKDGMLCGPNFKSIKEIAEAVEMGVIATGGISGIKDVEHLLAMEKYGVSGMIIGKAMYTGRIDLKAAIRLAKEYKPEPRRVSKTTKKSKKRT
jgi:phosphoribosylformimino-5-aminoimidazole carboxamide ribotide isomerase